MLSSWRAVVLVLAALLGLDAALAAQVPPRPTARVTDLANLLAPEQRQALEARLAAFERETTNQVAVLVVPTLAGESIEDVSQHVYTTWKLGGREVDNGVLLLIAVQEHRMRIHTGYGLEPSLPDGLAGAIIREIGPPHFRREDYSGRLNAALDRIFAATRNADIASVPARRAADARRAWGSRLALYLLLILGLIGLAHFAAHQFMGWGFVTLFGLSGAGLAAGVLGFNTPWRFLLGWAGLGIGLGVVQHFVEEYFRCPKCGGWLRRQVSPVLGSALASQEVVVSSCPRCRFLSRMVRPAAVWGSSAAGAGTGFWFGSGGGDWSSGGGGDSGLSGGGGESGGGGASGDW